MIGRKLKMRSRRSNGATIVETACAFMLLLPMMILVCFVAVEIAQVCMIKSVLNQCASTAARRLAVEYGSDPSNAVANTDDVFSNIRFNNIVVDNQQFKVPAGAAGWNLYSNPPTVTVAVTFQEGQYGLPRFLPDIGLPGFEGDSKFTSTSTANLE